MLRLLKNVDMGLISGKNNARHSGCVPGGVNATLKTVASLLVALYICLACANSQFSL